MVHQNAGGLAPVRRVGQRRHEVVTALPSLLRVRELRDYKTQACTELDNKMTVDTRTRCSLMSFIALTFPVFLWAACPVDDSDGDSTDFSWQNSGSTDTGANDDTGTTDLGTTDTGTSDTPSSDGTIEDAADIPDDSSEPEEPVVLPPCSGSAVSVIETEDNDTREEANEVAVQGGDVTIRGGIPQNPNENDVVDSDFFRLDFQCTGQAYFNLDWEGEANLWLHAWDSDSEYGIVYAGGNSNFTGPIGEESEATGEIIVEVRGNWVQEGGTIYTFTLEWLN